MNVFRHRLASALRDAATAIERGAPYEWGHVGRCNVGHVVQRLARMTDREIFAAFERTLDQWREHAETYFDAAVGDEPLATTEAPSDVCSTSRASIESIYRLFHAAGFDAEDIGHLEFLSDPEVLARIPPERRSQLRRNNPADVALYMRTLAQMLEPA
ncbi:MAG: hypothetical protein N2971_04545 [Chlorobi bacterium]|nr:hypothetical protein [Chlorobiota bacterium]